MKTKSINKELIKLKKNVCIKCLVNNGENTFGYHNYCNDCYDLLDLKNFKREIITLEGLMNSDNLLNDKDIQKLINEELEV